MRRWGAGVGPRKAKPNIYSASFGQQKSIATITFVIDNKHPESGHGHDDDLKGGQWDSFYCLPGFECAPVHTLQGFYRRGRPHSCLIWWTWIVILGFVEDTLWIRQSSSTNKINIPHFRYVCIKYLWMLLRPLTFSWSDTSPADYYRDISLFVFHTLWFFAVAIYWIPIRAKMSTRRSPAWKRSYLSNGNGRIMITEDRRGVVWKARERTQRMPDNKTHQITWSRSPHCYCLSVS